MKKQATMALRRLNEIVISKTAFLITVMSLAMGTAAAQGVVSGRVTGSGGEALPGVTVVVKGTGIATITDGTGAYSINTTGTDNVLVYNVIGYQTQEVTVGAQSVIDLAMAEDAKQIDQVVVTALGILRKEKSLTYSTSVVKGDELTRVKDANFINALAGKTAGVIVTRSSGGVGGSVKVQIRGQRSIKERGNEPLYVIDGMPINNNSYAQVGSTFGGTGDAGNVDTGDGISNINPDDIESMNILKGPAAAALYGSKAANGVVIIVTKKGRAGRTDVSFSNNTTFDFAVHGRPEFQDNYGGIGGDGGSWGAKITNKADYLKSFFQTGLTTINSVSMSAGNEMVQSYFSYGNTFYKGVVPGHKIKRHNFNFRETAKFFNNRLTVDANLTMMYQQTNNPANPGGYYMNPLVGLYRFPRGGSVEGDATKTIDYYKNNFEVLDKERNGMVQNWLRKPDELDQNPFWLRNRNPIDDRRFRTMANVTLGLKISDAWMLQARGNADYDSSFSEMRMYAGTTPSLCSSTGVGTNGRYRQESAYGLHLYGDLMLSFNKQLGDWGVNATLGTSIEDGHARWDNIDSKPGGLKQANVFNVNNILAPKEPGADGSRGPQEQAAFFAGQLSWRDQIYLDVTARNEWSSTLASTDHEKSGYFFPSVGLSWLLNETLSLPSFVSMGKVRVAATKVGNGLGYTGATDPIGSVRANDGNYEPVTTFPFTGMKPEMTTALEAGTEWRLFNNRVELELTYYNNKTRDQAFRVPAGAGAEYPYVYINAGVIENKGVEAMLAVTPILTRNVTWRTSVNVSANRNKISKMPEAQPIFVVADGGTNSYYMALENGGSFGDIYGRKFERDAAGQIVYDDAGMPKVDGTMGKLGNSAPKFNAGWQNTITLGSVSVNFLIDGRFGGKVMSMTQADLDQAGVSKRTGEDRDRGYVQFHGKEIKNIQGFYGMVGGRDGVSEHYMYDASNVRLRELSVAYSLPKTLFERSKFIKGVDVSIVGRNLMFLYNNAPYDTDNVLSTGNNLQGVDVYGLPTARSIGFNIKLNF